MLLPTVIFFSRGTSVVAQDLVLDGTPVVQPTRARLVLLSGLAFALGVAGDLASCGWIPPTLWAPLLTGCHYVGIVLAAVAFGHRIGVSVAVTAALVHVTVGMLVCDRSIPQQGEAATFVVVGLLAGFVTRYAPKLGESRFLRPSLAAPGQFLQSEESAKTHVMGSTHLPPGVVQAFRAPLAAIESAGFVLEETASTDENHREMAAIILKECHRLDVLTRSLELVQPRFPAYCEVQLSSLAGEIFLLATPATEAASITLRRAEGPNLKLLCDPYLIEQAVLNIMTNAIRLVGHGEEIVLSAHIAKGDAVIKISQRRAGVLGYIRIPMAAAPHGGLPKHSRVGGLKFENQGLNDRGKHSS